MNRSYVSKEFYADQVIFKEGSAGKTVYIVKSGKVEISKMLKSRKVVLTILDKGSIFGEMSLIVDLGRTATARALEYSEVVMVEKAQLIHDLNRASPMLKAIVLSLVHRLDETTRSFSAVSSGDLFASVCKVMELVFKAHVQSKPDNITAKSKPGKFTRKHQRNGQDSSSSNNNFIKVNLKEIISALKHTLSLNSMEIERFIHLFESINLFTLETEKDPLKTAHELQEYILLYDWQNFFKKAQAFKKENAEYFQQFEISENEIVDLDDISSIMDIKPENILVRIGDGEIPFSLFLFNKDDFLSWAGKKGKDYFHKKVPKFMTIAKLKTFADIAKLDNRAIQKILINTDMHALSYLLKYQEEKVNNRIMKNISPRVKRVLNEEMQYLDDQMDSIEYERYEWELIEKIKHQEGMGEKEENSPVLEKKSAYLTPQPQDTPQDVISKPSQSVSSPPKNQHQEMIDDFKSEIDQVFKDYFNEDD